MECVIVLRDEVNCYVQGLKPSDNEILKNQFSILTPTRFYQAAFKLGQWDGKISFFYEDGRTYVNLLEKLVPIIESMGYTIKLLDKRKSTAYLPEPIDKFYLNDIEMNGTPIVLRDEQVEVINALLASGGGIGKAATGAGKCVHPDTPIIMFDGTIKPIKDVLVGDILLGDDNTPRTVLEKTAGQSPMHKIIPTSKGHDEWIVNDKHILSLVTNADRNGTNSQIKKDEVLDIGIDEYLLKGNTFKHTFKQYSTGFDGWPEIEFPTDPYMIGLWLGDGCNDRPTIWNIDQEIIDYVYEYAEKNQASIKVYEQDHTECSGYSMVTHEHKHNHILEYFRIFKNSDGVKYIPPKYITSSRNQRLELLAGLIDSDGHLGRAPGGIEITQKSKPLSDAIVTIGRSLGFRVSVKEKLIKNTIYYVMYLSGDMSDIPCKLTRKQQAERNPNKNYLRTGFKVENLPKGDYIGIAVDGNQRFLKGDFTVIHNTLITGAMTLIHERMADLRVLTIVPNKTLVKQTHADYVMLGIDAGIFYGEEKELDHKHLVSTWQSLINSPHMMSEYDAVIVDEVHGAKGKSLQTLLLVNGKNIAYRYGVTGTMPKEEIDRMSINMALGEVVVDVGAAKLIEKGILSNLDITVLELQHNLEYEYEYYKENFRKSLTRPTVMTYQQFKDSYLPDWTAEKSYNAKFEDHMIWIAKKLESIRAEHGNTLCLVDGIKYGETLAELIPDCEFLQGKDKLEHRQEVYDKYKDSDDLLTIATSQIASTGLNIKRIFALCYINFGKSGIKVIQSIGRGLRTDDDKSYVAVYDFTNDFKYSRKHTNERIKFYKEEKYPHKRKRIKFSPKKLDLFD